MTDADTDLIEDVVDILPLAPLQQGILVHTLMAPESAAFHLQIELALEGQLDEESLVRAWRMLVQRHAALRTSFVWEGVERPYQLVHNEAPLDVARHDLRGLGDDERERRRIALLAEERTRPFDLETPPLVRLATLVWGDVEVRLIWTFHHIVLEGWSAAIVLGDLWKIYGALVAGASPDLLPPPEYAEFIHWLDTRDLGEAEQYWRERLQGFDAPIRLTIDRVVDETPPVVTHVEECRLSLPRALTASLQDFARAHRMTLNTVVQGAWSILLSRYSNEQDVLYGTTLSGRPPELDGVESMVGLFANALPVRVNVDPAASLLPWLSALQLDQVEMRQYEYVSLMQVQTWADRQGRPIFNAVLAFQNWLGDFASGEVAPGLRVRVIEGAQTSDQPLMCYVTVDEALLFQLVYDADRFTGESVERLLGHCQVLLQEIVRDPQRRIGDLSILTEAERHRLLVEWNSTAAPYDQDLCLHEVFEAQVDRTPAAVALTYEGTHLTYDELDRRANQLAHHLRGLGVGPDVRVGVFAERSLEMVVALYAVLKAGGAYVPLDPGYPQDRLGFMVEDADVPVLLTQAHLVDRLPPHRARVVRLDADWPEVARQDATRPKRIAEPTNLAYVIFTSGSTGRPKGAMNEHTAVVNRLQWMQKAYRLDASDAVLQKTPFSFDVSVWELFWPLQVGARMVIARPEGHKDPAYLIDVIRSERITTLHFVPSMLSVFLEADDVEACTSVKRVVTSGEALVPAHVDRLFARLPGAALYNLYGPTETAIDVTHWTARPGVRVVPIGQPIDNLQIYIVDDRNQPTPIGLPGELLIGGVGVGRGYLNRPDLTAEKFIDNPFGSGRLYRTGDLARWTHEGVIEYLGRIDHQVKIRGFRIELGEIESVLAAYPSVAEVVVVAREDELGEKRLVAYVVGRGQRPVTEALRAHAALSLPEYMVPSTFVVLDALPLTPSGKVDRKALPAPTAAGGVARAPYEPPRPGIETTVAEVWQELLGVPQVGRQDNFFALGGHSLLAVRLLAQMHRATSIRQPLASLFRSPKLAAFAALYASGSAVGATTEASHDAPDDGPLPDTLFPTPLQEGIWVGEHADPGTATNHVTGVRHVRGPLDPPRLEAALGILAARHDALRLRVRVVDGAPTLIHDPATKIPMRRLDLRAANAAERERALRDDLRTPFALDREAPFRVTLAAIGPDEHVLLFVGHHMFVEGNSFGVLVAELFVAYADPRASLPPAPSFRSWAVRHRAAVERGDYDAQSAYWKQRLLPAPTPLDLAVGEGDPSPPYEAASVSVPIPPALTQRVGNVEATPFLVVLAALQATLARYTGVTDIAIGVPAQLTADDERYARAVGLYINTLVVRDTVDLDVGFAERLSAVRSSFLDAWSHKDLPFPRVTEAVALRRTSQRNPYFQVMLSFEQTDTGALGRVGDLTFSRYDLPDTGTQAELAFYVRWHERDGAVTVDYDATLFSATQVRRLASHVLHLLAAGVAAPDTPLAALPLLDTAERESLDARHGATRSVTPETTVAMLESVCAAYGSRAAVTQRSGSLSYADLWSRSGRIASALAARGVREGTIVGVGMSRTPDMLVALLGIWRAGACYLPLDPAFPADRLAYMREDAGCELVIGDEASDGDGVTTVALLEKERTDPVPQLTVSAESLAYILYTSGSTGRPKGVEVPHGALANFLSTMRERPGLAADDVLLAVTTLSFDIAGLELWLPLTVGARVELATTEDSRDADALLERLALGITVLQATPATWRMLLQAGWSGRLRAVLCGGEGFPRELVAPLCERADAVWNMYGPTETTIWSTCARVTPEMADTGIPIGTAIANTRLFVMDTRGQLLPDGVPGELWIGGAGVARGYRGRADLTAERFVTDPGDPAQRAYRTGDLVRWRSDGQLEHLGRLDAQVKVNGYRIELGEVEAALASVANVRQAAVAVRGSEADPRLVAFVVPVPDASAPTSSEVRRALRKQLPDYMVPGMVIEVAELPLTPNGKVDRKALPDPFADANQSRVAYEPPLPGAEAAIAAVWQELLGVERIGRHDNFFDLGGHSLLSLRGVHRLREKDGIELDPRALYFSTLAQLAESTASGQ